MDTGALRLCCVSARHALLCWVYSLSVLNSIVLWFKENKAVALIVVGGIAIAIANPLSVSLSLRAAAAVVLQ